MAEIILPVMPLNTSFLDPRTGSMSRVWVSWFEEFALALEDVVVEQTNNYSSSIVSQITNIQSSVEDIRSEVSISGNSNTEIVVQDLSSEVSTTGDISAQVLNKIEELEKLFEPQSSLLHRIEELEKTISVLNEHKPPNLPFYLGEATKFDQDGILSFYNKARIGWRKYTAASTSVTGGTSASSASDLQTHNDGNIFTVAEVAASGITLTVTFTSVTAFNWVHIIGAYSGNAAHNVGIQIEITPFDGSAWHTLNNMDSHTNTEYLEDYSMIIPDDSIYINAGAVNIRFIHTTAAAANGHTLEVDVAALYQ